ncbi:MAG: hypothetical protein KGQ60_03720, partial [Planctomycetes bacterium]|nr:hypothetical protein [Planctomycetota bacterium]
MLATKKVSCIASEWNQGPLQQKADGSISRTTKVEDSDAGMRFVSLLSSLTVMAKTSENIEKTQDNPIHFQENNFIFAQVLHGLPAYAVVVEFNEHGKISTFDNNFLLKLGRPVDEGGCVSGRSGLISLLFQRGRN